MKEVLNKKALADKLADKFEITKKAANEELQFLLDEIVAELVKGNAVDLSGFGKFSVKVKPAHEGVNPSTKEKMHIAETKAVNFRVANALKDSVK